MRPRCSSFALLAAVLAAAAALSACGQTGALYLPDEDDEPRSVIGVEPGASQDSDEEGDHDDRR